MPLPWHLDRLSLGIWLVWKAFLEEETSGLSWDGLGLYALIFPDSAT